MLDIKAVREHARKRIGDGAMTPGYGLGRNVAVDVLNAALATELVCVMRYRQHHFVATGINSEPIAQEFLVHSNEELGHADQIARRIVQLGGKPGFGPDTLAARSHAEYVTSDSLEDMIRENLIAERIAIESYREIIRRRARCWEASWRSKNSTRTNSPTCLSDSHCSSC